MYLQKNYTDLWPDEASWFVRGLEPSTFHTGWGLCWSLLHANYY